MFEISEISNFRFIFLFSQSRALRGNKVDDVLSAEEKALEREAKRGMNDDEATFSVESNVEHSYEWSDKYRYGRQFSYQGVLEPLGVQQK